jgi:hypothetical protein
MSGSIHTQPDPGLRATLAAAQASGAQFWVQGAELHGRGVPRALYERLDPSAIWDYVTGTNERPCLDLMQQLGVAAELIETTAALRHAVRQIERDKARYGRPLGLDIETAVRPEFRKSPMPLVFTKSGKLAEHQPKDASGNLLDSHIATIATLQLYAGGEKVFVVRRAALMMLLHSHWLRRQVLVVHNASFEVRFIAAAAAGYRARPDRRRTGGLHCTMQGAGLLLGFGYSPTPRALESVAKKVFGLTVTKAYATSDWSAPLLRA